MRMYELIKRLEHIRDKMESTFSNEFQRGEIDNLIEELIKMTPEVGQIDKMPISQPFQLYPHQPGTPWVTTPSPYIGNGNGSVGTAITLTNTTSSNCTYEANASSGYNDAKDARFRYAYAGILESKTLTVS